MTNKEAIEALKKLDHQIFRGWWNDIALNEEENPNEYSDSLEVAVNALGAIEQIRWERDTAIEQLHELGYGLGEKPKYRWHDLRKNPEDLPKREGYYLCKCGTGSWEYRVMFYEVINGYNKEADRWRDREIGMVFNHFIIAWREIEPFEEVEG